MAEGYPLSAIAAALGGSAHGPSSEDPLVSELVIDSRGNIPPQGALFFALRGPRNDGHRYLPELQERGLRMAVIANDAEAPAGLWTIRVADTRAALQRLAAWHRQQFTLPVVGITGSNGKTMVKEWLYQALRATDTVVRSPGSWNSQVGVPLSVWELAKDSDIALFEAGISEPGEMDALATIIAPTLGIFTNIGPAHGARFSNELEKALTKAQLFRSCHAVVHCRDHATVVEALERSGTWQHAQPLHWSRQGDAYLRVEHEAVEAGHTVLLLRRDTERFSVRIPFTDGAGVENVLHVITLLLHLGRSSAWVAERIAGLDPIAMRLRTVSALGGGTLVDDAYSNDPASFAVALRHVDTLAVGRERTVVLSDMLEPGISGEALHGRIAAALRQYRVDRLIGIGPDMAAHAALYPANSIFLPDVGELLRSFPHPPSAGITLVKGARSFALERVVAHWEERSHGTVLEIDHEAVRDNLNSVRALVEGRPVMAMLKADAYGSGAVELARLFAHEGLAYFGVAYVDEGVELRRNGIRTPVLVMNPEPLPLELLQRYRLETEVYDQRSLEEAIAFAQHVPDAPPIHIEIDTGMRRLGFPMDALPTVAERLRQAGKLRVASIMTHLAAAEDPHEDAYTRQQLALFRAGCDRLTEVLDHLPLRHAANTAGAVRFPEARLDMVRLGIGMHGIAAPEPLAARLRPSTTLSTLIAQLRTIAPGDSVGYNRRFVAQRPTTLAVLPIGYADGLPRRLGGNAWGVRIHGRTAAYAGTICMDMCMVDVTDIPCAIGDPVTIFGPDHPIEGFAQAAGTIPYEVLTGISHRVKRVHWRV